VLTAAGIPDVRILDGGLTAWTAAGRPLHEGVFTPAPGDITVTHENLYAGALPTVTADTLPVNVLDARAPERYRGDVEPVDPVAGHIPGAVNVPSTSVLAEDGTLKSADDLTRLFGDVPTHDVAVYCGSGITASVTVAALKAVGVDAALYPGSWSEWCSR
jgi:thiosulfate/3-mercaptopyruvate sulfurtransferase